jgi:hypothetical protein
MDPYSSLLHWKSDYTDMFNLGILLFPEYSYFLKSFLAVQRFAPKFAASGTENIEIKVLALVSILFRWSEPPSMRGTGGAAGGGWQ